MLSTGVMPGRVAHRVRGEGRRRAPSSASRTPATTAGPSADRRRVDGAASPRGGGGDGQQHRERERPTRAARWRTGRGAEAHASRRAEDQGAVQPVRPVRGRAGAAGGQHRRRPGCGRRRCCRRAAGPPPAQRADPSSSPAHRQFPYGGADEHRAGRRTYGSTSGSTQSSSPAQVPRPPSGQPPPAGRWPGRDRQQRQRGAGRVSSGSRHRR